MARVPQGLAVVFVAFAAGAAAASAGWFAARTGGDPPPASPAPGARDGGPAAPQPSAAPLQVRSEGSTDVARRLDELAAKLDALTAAVQALHGGREPAATAAAIDENALAEALTRAQALREQQRIAQMSDAELLAEARRLGQKGGDPAAASALLEQLLARDLLPAQRIDAMVQLGMVQRDRDPKQSMATLQSAIDLAGADTPAGVSASLQLGWSALLQGDHARTFAVADEVLRSPGLSAKLRPTARWQVALAAIDLGDLNRARSELATLRSEAAGSPEVAKITADIEQRLAGR